MKRDKANRENLLSLIHSPTHTLTDLLTGLGRNYGRVLWNFNSHFNASSTRFRSNKAAHTFAEISSFLCIEIRSCNGIRTVFVLFFSVQLFITFQLSVCLCVCVCGSSISMFTICGESYDTWQRFASEFNVEITATFISFDDSSSLCRQDIERKVFRLNVFVEKKAAAVQNFFFIRKKHTQTCPKYFAFEQFKCFQSEILCSETIFFRSSAIFWAEKMPKWPLWRLRPWKCHEHNFI